MAKYLVVEHLAKLLDEREHDPNLEVEYRRGYTDGAGALFQHRFPETMAEVENSTLAESLWAWYQKLLSWQQGEPEGSQPPPAFAWKEQLDA